MRPGRDPGLELVVVVVVVHRKKYENFGRLGVFSNTRRGRAVIDRWLIKMTKY